MTLALPPAPLHDATAPRLATALAVSLVAHALALAGLALVTGLGASGGGDPFDTAPLRATLAAAPPRAPPAAAPVPAPAPAALAPTVAAPATAPLPVPWRPPPPTAPAATGSDGSVAILADDGSAVGPALEAAIAATYPGATRTAVEFDVPPRAAYPDAARRERRQVLLRVPAVVREDGSMEIAQGTFEDPVFGEAVREALANARVRDPPPDGAPRTWTLLTFHFESYASGESQRSNYEAPAQ